jgi:tRNA pseudouridine(38-40) synthase
LVYLSLLISEYPNVAPTDIASSVEQHFQTDHKKRKATSSPPALHTVSQSGSVPIDSASASKPASKAPRTFAWNKYHQRHIALHFAYIGAEYTGLAAGNLSIAEQEIDQFIEHKQLPPGGANPSASRPQPNWSERAVEVQVLYALKKCRLLRTIGEAQYQRCGRTDKGVSAMGQVVTLNVRTNLTAGVGVLPPFESADPAAQIAPVTDESKEFDYITLINRMLPDDIQVLGWAPMEPTFDARFSCTYRQYKYFFFGDNMDIGRMQQAANALIGRHDFRNFARLDTANLTENTVRVLSAFRIESADRAFDDTANLRDLQDGSHFRVSALGRFLVNKDVDADQISQNDGNWNFPTMEVCSSSSESTTSTRGPLSSMPGDQLFVMTITGQAFLWHQVRCMAAILMLVGSGQEDVSIVQRLLDIEATPRKPVVLFEIEFNQCFMFYVF